MQEIQAADINYKIQRRAFLQRAGMRTPECVFLVDHTPGLFHQSWGAAAN